MSYRIAEVAQLTGFTPATLRYYETAGVVSPPARTESGYRLYDERDVERLRLVARAKELGCTLEEIAGLVEAWDADACEPVKHRLRSLVGEKVAEVERHVSEQVAFAAELQATAAALADRPVDGPCDERCGCASVTAAPEPEIACTLERGDVPARVDEWRALLARVERREPITDGVRLVFGSPAPLDEIARLAAAEQGCCAFFAFAITVDGRGIALEVRAPADGQPVLRSLFGAAV